MTLEQENELVARWMGWTFSVGNGPYIVGPYWGRGEHEIYRVAPPYRTDPALLWELAVRLAYAHRGEWVLRSPSFQFRIVDDFHMQPFTVDFAEAVFAAAVMQAEQEGK